MMKSKCVVCGKLVYDDVDEDEEPICYVDDAFVLDEDSTIRLCNSGGDCFFWKLKYFGIKIPKNDDIWFCSEKCVNKWIKTINL